MNRFIYSIFALLLIITSCEEIIQVDLTDDPGGYLIVEGGITDEANQVFTIRLTHSMAYYDPKKTPAETGASVTISDSVAVYSLTESEPGYYITDPLLFKASAGKIYKLSIKLTNGEEYEAFEKMNPLPIIDSVRWMPNKSLYSNRIFYYVLLFGLDYPGDNTAYEWNYYMPGQQSDTLREKTISSGAFSNTPIFKGLRPVYVFSDRDLKDTVTLVTIETKSVSVQYTQFVNELLSQSVWRGGFFETPPANIKSSNIKPVNHEKEAFGYFTASSVIRHTVWIDKRLALWLLEKK